MSSSRRARAPTRLPSRSELRHGDVAPTATTSLRDRRAHAPDATEALVATQSPPSLGWARITVTAERFSPALKYDARMETPKNGKTSTSGTASFCVSQAANSHSTNPDVASQASSATRASPTDARFEAAVAESVARLASPEAAAALGFDPYWPKWDGPWWHMVVLDACGLADRIPAGAAEAMLAAIRRHYIPYFPFRVEDVPPGVDPMNGVLCHCSLGTMYGVLHRCGIDVDRELPWARPWFLRYQMPDGGLNCDEAAYLKPSPRSSPLSTLPCLEAVLDCTPRPLTDAETAFLDHGARWLIEHRIVCRKAAPTEVIDTEWLSVVFPRFYHYDVLRGLAWLCRWAERLGRTIPEEAVAVARSQVASTLDRTTGWPRLGPAHFAREGTRYRADDGTWARRSDSRRFPLLDLVSEPGSACRWLAADVAAIRRRYPDFDSPLPRAGAG